MLAHKASVARSARPMRHQQLSLSTCTSRPSSPDYQRRRHGWGCNSSSREIASKIQWPSHSIQSAAATVVTTLSVLLSTPTISFADTLPSIFDPVALTAPVQAPGPRQPSLDSNQSDALLKLMLNAADRLSKSAGNLLLLNVEEAKAEELLPSNMNVVDVALKMSEDALTLAQEAGELAALSTVSVSERELAVAIEEAAKIVSSVAHHLALTEQISASNVITTSDT